MHNLFQGKQVSVTSMSGYERMLKGISVGDDVGGQIMMGHVYLLRRMDFVLM